MYQTSKRWTFTPNVSGIAGGMYTFGALLLRCSAAASVLYRVLSLTYQMLILLWMLYFALGICLFSHLNGLLLLLLKGRRMWSWASQLEIRVAAYVSATIGLLYAIIENDSRGRNPKLAPWARLGLSVGIDMLPDLLVVLWIPADCKSSLWSGTILALERCETIIMLYAATTGVVLCFLPPLPCLRRL